MRGIGWTMLEDGSLEPPPRLVRFGSVGLAVVTLVNLPDDHAPHEIAFAAFICLMALGATVGAKPLADGRVDRWARAHPVLYGAIVAALLVTCCFALVSEFGGERIGLLVGVPSGVLLAVIGIVRERSRHARAADTHH
ncbi:hypothetical protein [Kribbella sp. NPDC051770]|uniref:hypothetical protein n=1 Tax=Kribbella sp. NPDC051770 TaxID=3155413 RepID=UPI0034360279